MPCGCGRRLASTGRGACRGLGRRCSARRPALHGVRVVREWGAGRAVKVRAGRAVCRGRGSDAQGGRARSGRAAAGRESNGAGARSPEAAEAAGGCCCLASLGPGRACRCCGRALQRPLQPRRDARGRELTAEPSHGAAAPPPRTQAIDQGAAGPAGPALTSGRRPIGGRCRSDGLRRSQAGCTASHGCKRVPGWRRSGR